MAEQRQDERSETSRQLKRRGLIAGAAALAAAALAKLAGPERAEASHDGAGTVAADLVFHLGVINDGTNATNSETATSLTSRTVLVANTASSDDAALRVRQLGAAPTALLNSPTDAIRAIGADASSGSFRAGRGLRADGGRRTGGGGQGGLAIEATGGDVVSPGTGPGGNGIEAFGGRASGAGFMGGSGVDGIGGSGSNGATSGIGVFGRGGGPTRNGIGVQGVSDSAVGVHGISVDSFGVRGDSTNNIGVLGVAGDASNASPGVFGSATQGYGVFGFSANSNGIAGQSGTSAAGCVGFAGAPGGYGIFGGIAVQGGFAGGFAGPVLVVGDFTVANGAKNAAVPHPDGSHRLLYCQESPEPWFEDFGEARLINGRAQVALDPDFIAVVHNDKYFVYLTPEADSNGLYVSNKSGAGFEVREQRSGTSSLAFSYRVVAKRKDIPGPRLGKIKLPQPIKELKRPPEPPRPAEPPAPPAESERSGR